MAGESCSLTCNVRDSRGRIKVSQLWKDLADFFKGDRREAIVHYFLSKDPNFLTSNADVLRFDDNGEVTIASLKKALEQNGEFSKLDNKRTKAHLNRELKAGKYDYSEALDNVLKFNRSSQFSDGFMATLRPETDGKYSIEVVERNSDEEYKLADHIQNKILTDAIRLVLKDMGLSVEFLNNPSYGVKYSTENLHLDADGLMAVASVVNGQSSSIATAEAAGHFIVAAMQGNPLMDRLIRQLTPEVQKALFATNGSEFQRDNFVVSDDSAREAAGILVGKALLKPFQHKTVAMKIGKAVAAVAKGAKNTVTHPISSVLWILKKAVDLARRIFGKTKPDDIQRMIDRAKDAAMDAVYGSKSESGFMSNPDAADVRTALNTPETFVGPSVEKRLSDAVKENVKAYNDTLESLKSLISQLRDSTSRAIHPSNKDLFKHLTELAKNTRSNFTPDTSIEAIAKVSSLEGMVYMLEGLTQLLDTDIRNILNSIQPSDRTSSYVNIADNARNMRTVNTAVKNIAAIYLALNQKLNDLSAEESISLRDADGNLVGESLKEAVERLGDVLVGNDETYKDSKGNERKAQGLQGLLELKRKQLFTDAIREFYGSDYVERNAGKVWSFRGKEKGLINSSSKPKKVADFMESLDSDISWVDRYLSSAADCGDFVTAVGDKVTKIAKIQAYRMAAKYWDDVETLRAQMKDAFGDTDCIRFYELMDDDKGGTIKTGNLITRTNYGAWEKARKEFKEQLKKDFNNYLADLIKKDYENNKDNKYYKSPLSDYTDTQRAVLYNIFVEDKWKKWHAENSEEDNTGGGKKWVPNHVKYHNQQWDNLFDTENPSLSNEEKEQRKKQLRVYQAILDLKESMDALYPQNATVVQRAPQFYGNMYHRFKALQGQHGNAGAFGRAIIKRASDSINIREDEAYLFGSENEYNELGDDPMENEMYHEKEKIDRLPIVGINKVKDMNNLSTDLFGSLLRYGSMAASYRAMEQVVDIFELGRDVLKERKVGNKTEPNRKHQSRAYGRYSKFMDKGVYGLNVELPKWVNHKGLLKFASELSSLGGRILLQGNVHGGIVNTGTGMFEILKEAAAGENFNVREVRQAHQMYFDSFLGPLLPGKEWWKGVGNDLLNKQRPDDKNSLWIRHWQILSETSNFYNTQQYDVNKLNNRLWEWFGHSMMLPYSSGDHYMQTIPYYAMGLHTKVYDHDGNEMSLMDAYDIVDGEEINPIEGGNQIIGITHKKLKLKEGIFRNVEDIDKYDTVTGMLAKIKELFDKNPSLKDSAAIAADLFTDEERQYINDEHLNMPTTVKQLMSLRTALDMKLSDLTFNTDDEASFMLKCRNINNRLHGIYNTEDRVPFQQNFYGNLVMSMRGYALGMINRRYADSRYNVLQGKTVEGSMNTALKVFASACYDINNWDNWKASLEATLFAIPFANLTMFNKKYSNKVKADMQKAGFSEHQYYNMRRFGMDYLVLEALALLRLLSSPGFHFGLGDDDEDKNNKVDTEDNWLAGIIYYFTNRWFNEQGAFNWPPSTIYEFNTLLDWAPAGFSGFKSMLDIAWLIARTQADAIGGNPSLDNSDLYYQSSKEGKYEEGDAKWKIKFKRLTPYFRSFYTFTHPYDSSASYDYGRMMRGH